MPAELAVVRRALPLAVVGTAVVCYAATFSIYTSLKYMAFGFPGFDLGIHDQAIWQLSRFHRPFNTVRGLFIFGDHVWFISLLLAPLYWVWSDARMLLVAQSAACALAALPVYAMARRVLPSSAAAAAAVAFLLYPALQNVNLDQFHPEAMVTPFLLAALASLLAGRRRAFTFWIGLSLLCKEDVALTVIALGLWMAWQGERRWGLGTALVGAAYLALCLYVVLPHFNGVGFFRHTAGYWFAGVHEHFLEPGFWWARLASRATGRYVHRLLWPVAYLALLQPDLAAVALPAIVVNASSGVSYLRSVDYHYTAAITPALWGATILGLGRLHRRHRLAGTVAVALLCGAAVHSQVSWSHLPLTRAYSMAHGYYTWLATPRAKQVAALLAEVPRDAAVSADPFFVPHLTHRDRIYEFPNPFINNYWGIRGEKPHPGGVVEYVVLKDTIAPRNQRVISTLLASGQFVVQSRRADLLLLRRRLPAPGYAAIEARVYRMRRGDSLRRIPSRPPDQHLWLSTVDFPRMPPPLRSILGQTITVGAPLLLVLRTRLALTAPAQGAFVLWGDGPFRLSVGGQVVAERRHRAPFGPVAAAVRVEAGAPLELRYVYGGGVSGLRLEWRPPGRGATRVLGPRALRRPREAAVSVPVGGALCPRCNVVVVSVDTLRADHLGLGGYPRPTSPNLDRLAAQSVVFATAISQSAWTAPVHASMFTGLYPAEHGILAYPATPPLPAGVPTLAELLRQAGYSTAAFHGGRYVSSDWGLDRGFEVWKSPGLDFDRTVAAAVDWLSTHGQRPFFLFVHGFDVHRPHVVGPPYNRLFAGGYRGSYNLYDFCKAPLSTEDLEFVISQYDGQIRRADAYLGVLLDALRIRGLADKTVVVVTSDHGEEFFEHGNCDHVKTLYEEIVHVPLIVHVPGRRAMRIADPVAASVALAPTVLELVGRPLPGPLDRRSLVPLMQGGPNPFPFVVSETASPPNRKDGTVLGGRGHVVAIRQGRWKLILNVDRPAGMPETELFDLAADPGEKHNLASRKPARVKKLRGELRSWRRGLARVGKRTRRPVRLPRRLRQQLRALGYVGGN